MKHLMGAVAIAMLVAGAGAAQDAPPAGGRGFGGPPRTLTKAMMRDMAGRMFDRLDADEDGVVTADEARAMAPPPPPPPPPPPADDGTGNAPRGPRGMAMMGPDWFARADLNHDGKVTMAEADKAAAAAFDRMDTDHDGTVSPEERHAAMQAMRGGPGAPPPADGVTPPPAPPQK